MTSSIQFPPGTITSKLSSKMLKNTPISNDWMHQTYMQMVQDVSYATSHYYESNENGTGLLINVSEPNREANSSTLETIIKNSPPKKSSPLSMYEYHDDSSTEDDDECQTYTTSSTDQNRRNNIYRLYREQQNIDKPIEEEITIVKLAECDSQEVSPNVTQTTSKYKKFKRIMTKMRMAAEKPFWAIDSHF
ncbi:hypothetical protein INT47_012622 [Mucor saturninus]|uniref:Uncharacterized protein n=1 Tax=Mucor saturninus TaxID=64648 RepID=A0A8H7V5W6_9FUNG|nr:hypothetical protein INT47_012622 [Mucor saturninus]